MTAAHVLEHNQPSLEAEASSLYVGGVHELFLLEAEFLSNNEPADLAVAPLNGALARSWDLLPALDIESQIAWQETTGLHLVLGYPIRRAAFNLDRAAQRIHHEAFKYAANRIDRPEDGNLHFSLRMDRSHVKSGDSEQSAASPRGVSGGAVFTLTTPSPVLAGILIEYVNGTHLVATKARCLAAFVGRAS